MDTITHLLSTPMGLASLFTLGVALLVAAVFATVNGFKIPRDGPRHFEHWILMVRALRLALTGACVIALGAGLALDTAALIVPAIIIGLEELYETSMVLAVLNKAKASRTAGAPPVSIASLMTARPGRW